MAARRLVQIDYELIAIGKHVTTQGGMDKVCSQSHVASGVEASHQRSPGQASE
jgi:hypothetical protein